MGDLRANIIRIPDLRPEDAGQMYALFERYYDAVDFEMFRADLAEKDFVVLLTDHFHQVRGFSTLAVIKTQFEGQPVRALFSGDTIVDHLFWGEQTLPQAWCKLAGQIKSEAPHTPLYWFLIVKGQKTFRFMTLFSKLHYPSWRHPTPLPIKALMNHLGKMKFPENYDPESGLVRFPQSKGHLKTDFAFVREGVRLKPDVKFFLDKNPHYYRGDELLCLTELSLENMRSIARRSFEQGLSEGLIPLQIQKPVSSHLGEVSYELVH